MVNTPNSPATNGHASGPVTFLEAIKQAMFEEMQRDPAVVLIGEDVGVYGGAFKTCLLYTSKPNDHAENEALQGLARVMATAPDELVDTLLRTALELCSAGTAGLSLLETPPEGEPIFRWTNLAGALCKHLGATTPRHFSPSGVTLDANSPQLFAYPGRRFPYFNGLDFPIVEALVIPVDLAGEIPGTLWVVSHDDETKFDAEDARIMTGLAEFTGCALRMTRLSEVQQTARLKGDKEIAAHRRTETALRQTQASMEVDIAARAAQLEQLSARPVSYTHLDVYKRQVLFLAARRRG